MEPQLIFGIVIIFLIILGAMIAGVKNYLLIWYLLGAESTAWLLKEARRKIARGN
ncbi:MAG TPA: hypothetical protein VHO03_16630 [Ignavibacteriales bacterium]|nr:hypothetical protein [Ignavibacteriales bacterium]